MSRWAPLLQHSPRGLQLTALCTRSAGWFDQRSMCSHVPDGQLGTQTRLQEAARCVAGRPTAKSSRSCWYRRSMEHGAKSVTDVGNGACSATRKLALQST